MMLKVVLHPSLQLMCSSWANLFFVGCVTATGTREWKLNLLILRQPQSVMLLFSPSTWMLWSSQYSWPVPIR